MALTYADLDRLKEEMKSLPAPPRDKLTPNKQEAVKMLAGEIVDLQKRGFTIEQIASWLKGKGLELNAPTLKSYLARANAKKRPKAAAPRTRKIAAKKSTKDAHEKLSESPEPSAQKKDPKAAFLASDKPSY